MKGRGTNDEKSILQELIAMVGNDYMPYWILWKYAPDWLPKQFKTYDDLVANYKTFQNKKLTERDCDKFIYYDKVQNAIKWLLKKQKGARMIALYNIWFERAKQDPNALKEFLKLQDEYFKGNQLSELESILKQSTVSDEEEEYEMDV